MSPLTTAGAIIGTIQCISPEQIEGKEADARSDLFALGAVLYEMTTRRRSFEGKSQSSVASAILEKIRNHSPVSNRLRRRSRPIVSLQGLDRHARVIYIGTFSKVLFPALRLGYVVVPHDLVPAFAACREAADIFPSTLYQAVLTDFIQEGHFARHIRRMRTLYMERRSLLVKAIKAHMGRTLEVIGAEAGMHLVALLPGSTDDSAIARKAAKRGISAMPLSSCYLKRPTRMGLILGYGGINGQQINEAMRDLKRIVQT